MVPFLSEGWMKELAPRNGQGLGGDSGADQGVRLKNSRKSDSKKRAGSPSICEAEVEDVESQLWDHAGIHVCMERAFISNE
jgi:hypothetical protein